MCAAFLKKIVSLVKGGLSCYLRGFGVSNQLPQFVVGIFPLGGGGANRKYAGIVKMLTRITCGGLLGVLLVKTACGADRREYQHGVEFVPAGGSLHWLIWSSSEGKPPTGKNTFILPDGAKCGYFTHDIYYSRIDSGSPQVDPARNALRLVSLPEAQEPVSAALAGNSILVTFEDGSDSNVTSDCWGVIQQRYMLFDAALNPVSDRRTVNKSGAHSGHVAAVGKQFVIVYGEGWVDEGNDNFGTGKSIFLDVINAQAELLRHRSIEAHDATRDWWPLVAGSDRYAMLLWQRYVNNTSRALLMYAVYDPVMDRFLKPPEIISTDVYYYHYDVQYLATINRFLVSGNHLGNMLRETNRGDMPLKTQKGFVYLLAEDGAMIDHWSASSICEPCSGYHTHPFVREAQPAVHAGEADVKVLYPVKPKGALLFSVTTDAVKLLKYVPDDYYWHSLGTDGIFLDQHTAYFATLSPLGLQTRTIIID